MIWHRGGGGCVPLAWLHVKLLAYTTTVLLAVDMLATMVVASAQHFGSILNLIYSNLTETRVAGKTKHFLYMSTMESYSDPNHISRDSQESLECNGQIIGVCFPGPESATLCIGASILRTFCTQCEKCYPFLN